MKSFPRLWRGLWRSPNRRRQRAAGEKFFEDRLGYPTKILIYFRNDKHFMALILFHNSGTSLFPSISSFFSSLPYFFSSFPTFFCSLPFFSCSLPFFFCSLPFFFCSLPFFFCYLSLFFCSLSILPVLPSANLPAFIL